MAPFAQCSATLAGSRVATCSCVDGLHHPTTGARQSFGETVACPFSSSSSPGGAVSSGVSRISARGGASGQAPYEKWGGGRAIRFRSDTKSGGGGGADTFVWHKDNTLSLIINGYNFDQGGCSSTSHARANELNCLF